MTVVCNASPIINLAAIGKLELLAALYGTICIPEEVYREITDFEGQPGAEEVMVLDWIVHQPGERRDLVAALQGELDAGEAAAIALAVELEADLLLIDEQDGRRAAARLGVDRLGLLGVLLEAKGQGHISAIRPLVDALRAEAGFWISDALHHHVLQLAGE